MRELFPETVQIGPYTYQICYLENGDPKLGEAGGLAYDRILLEIYIPNEITPQVQATWLLATVLEITLRNMGVENYDNVSRELAYHLASTWGASPNVVAFIEGGLLSRRPDWVAKIDDNGHNPFEMHTEDLEQEADEALKAMGSRCIIIGKQNDPTRPFYDQPMEPVDLECDANHSPMAATNPAHKFKSVGYRTLELRPENGSLTGHISQDDYSAIVNSGWDTFDHAYEGGRLLYRDGRFELAKAHHVPDAVRDAIGLVGLSVEQALGLGAVEIVNGVVQLTMRGDAFPLAKHADGPAWNIKTFDCEKFIHFSDDEPDVYWSLENGRAGRVREEEDGRVRFDSLGVWADYYAAHPRITGEPVRDTTGRQYQTVLDDDVPLTRTRILPYGYHPPQAKG